MAHNNLGLTLVSLGRTQEGIGQYEDALRINRITPRRTTIWGSRWRKRAGWKTPSGSMNRRCGSSRNTPRRRAIWGQPWGRPPDAGSDRAPGAGAADRARFCRSAPQLGARAGSSWPGAGSDRPLAAAAADQPQYAEPHYYLGVASEQAGRMQEAIAHYEQALRINPDFAEARAALAQLQGRQ